MTTLKPGDQLGRYVLEGPLGAGGMGSVWVAVQEGLGRRVALKVMHSSFVMDATIAARFRQEAQIAASFNHPGIVPVTDFGVHDGRPYLVMDLLEGESMDHLLVREGRLSAERAAFLAMQILAALEAAHAKDVVHRDLKPENVFVTSSSGVGDVTRLLDFGIARLSEGRVGAKMTSTGQVLGTPAYMAPEQAKGQPAEKQSDLYSVGVILYEALTGRMPFEAGNYHQLMFAIVDANPAPLGTLRPDLDPAFVALVERAMAKSPKDRFPSAAAMRDALAPFGRVRSMTSIASAEPEPRSHTDTDPLAATMASPSTDPHAATMVPSPEAPVAAALTAAQAAPPKGPTKIAFAVAGAISVLLAVGGLFVVVSQGEESVEATQTDAAVVSPVTPVTSVPPVTPEPSSMTPQAPPPSMTAPTPPTEQTMAEAPADVERRAPSMHRRPSKMVPAAPSMTPMTPSMSAAREGYAMATCGGNERELRIVQPHHRVVATFGMTNNVVRPPGVWRGRLNEKSAELGRCFVGHPMDSGQRVDVQLSAEGRITQARMFRFCPVPNSVERCVERVMGTVDYSDVVQNAGAASFGLSLR